MSEVSVGGGSLPAIRVALNPDALFNQNVSLDDVRKAINQANVRRPQGFVNNDENRWQIQTNDELSKAAEYRPIIVHYNQEAVVRLGDVAQVTDSVQKLTRSRDEWR